MKLFVARYYCPGLAAEPLVKVGITVGKPHRIKYSLATIVSPLAPHGRLFDMTDPDEFIPLYVERLVSHGVEQLRGLLTSISQANGGGDLVLLCYEDCRYNEEDGLLNDWCHRLVFAAWWYDQTGEPVLDVEHLRQGRDKPLTLAALRELITAPRQGRLL